MTLKQYLSPILVALLLVACSSSEQLPNQSTVRISPGEKTFEIAPPEDGINQCYEGAYQDIPLLISVLDDQGTPLGGIDVGVYVDFSANTFSGPDVLRLFYDRNGNGVVDEETEFVSSIGDGGFVTKTHKYNGNVLLMLRINLSCAYKGSVFAYAGPYSTQMPINLVYESSQVTQNQELGN